jgi:glycosyltransferase involved in cell wall biosynthesis
MNPFVTIIIPCHNRASILDALVGSIPSVEGLEVIVVDDHSTEDLSEVSLKRFRHHKFIKNAPGLRNAGTARNTGLEHASGDYVFFADSDDLIVRDGFIKCLSILRDKKPDILFAKCTSFKDGDGGPGKRHINYNLLVQLVINGAPVEILARSVVPWAKFICRGFLNRHHLRFEPQRYSNDIVFSAALLTCKASVHVTEEVVYSVREGNDSLTSDLSLDSSLMRIEALCRYNAVLKGNGMGYLMVSALPFLARMFRRDKCQTIVCALRIRTSGYPIFYTWWSLKKIYFRWRIGI